MVYYVFGHLFDTRYVAERYCDQAGFDYSVIYPREGC